MPSGPLWEPRQAGTQDTWKWPCRRQPYVGRQPVRTVGETLRSQCRFAPGTPCSRSRTDGDSSKWSDGRSFWPKRVP